MSKGIEAKDLLGLVVKRNDRGYIDAAKTTQAVADLCAAVTRSVEAIVKEDNAIMQAVSDAILTVFEAYPGAALNVPYVVRNALANLENHSGAGEVFEGIYSTKNEGVLTKRINAFLTDHAKGNDSMFIRIPGSLGGGLKIR